MVPPWVIFDESAAFGGDCDNGAEPDISGIGVVIAFVFASIMTTAASILAMLLDQTFNIKKGHFEFRKPLKYFRDKFLRTEWRMNYAWRPFLDPLIIGLGDQQLITGYAVLLSGWMKVAQNSLELQGAHFVLILYICTLSSSSHLAALITLRKYFQTYKLIAKIRMTMVVVFALFLLCSMIASLAVRPHHGDYRGSSESQQRAHRLSFLVPMFFMLVGYSTALICILYRPRQTELAYRSNDMAGLSSMSLVRRGASFDSEAALPKNVGSCIMFFLVLNPLLAFIIQIILMILSVVLVLSQKFSRPQDKKRWCGLDDAGENTWEFGQTLSVVMLLLPAMSAGQTYLEGRQVIKDAH
ncbi:hypothetical protein BU24DRAFT_459686 [Aaosphaeria arxii CBS 175.79]|uniref:Uncharacterized protein n=1 Tax=Aaosphaeria arxii CBS 175.79 TaxID=1450172 RepID=A0A6A5Y5F0_9PLEO|nr:uncharacterized protein BU24DRAFT_459686 [Aaosphaeria arxii CBS 175.79]KAF2020071.1 hypothetical protein BU24DRAFT_459686 [Aaosphaeria arxii CBS 175.79]